MFPTEYTQIFVSVFSLADFADDADFMKGLNLINFKVHAY